MVKSVAGSYGDGPPTNEGMSRADFVYSTLRVLIRDGQLRPGDRVFETELAGQLGVSRTPVREALRRLETDGLLAYGRGRGLSVAELDQQQVLELYSLREALEGTAARFAAQHASDIEIHALRDLIQRQAGTSDTDAASLAQSNRQFHQTIYQAARNRYLIVALSSLQDSLALLKETTYSAPGRPATALEEHIKIVDSIERRDADAADAAARHHIQSAQRARLSLQIQTT